MLTIKNYERLKYRTIGKTNWYVGSILPAVVIIDLNGKHKNIYKIEITDRQSIRKLELNREQSQYKNYKLSLGMRGMQIELSDISDQNELLKCIEFLMIINELK